ncbi:ferritin-like domain-containing protein [Pandoraea sputorum]|uniref:ferritin-like domain-containing protein n=1 Tax=Pandoraea sputorum TaxID=93222 RepID=UPI001E5B54CE|nr:ferritin-like domain-containing protein [Pandoraea sputorum]MCE4058912.1 ferritin-like domain-containing protein [Pandoraea sputorum]
MADFTPAPGADAARHAVSGKSIEISSASATESSSADVSGCARERALELLRVCDPFEKATGVTALRDAVRGGAAHWHPARRFLSAGGEHEAGIPGRPPTPQLVSPRELKQRAVTSVDGRAALLHALAHIEFNAINLALDALWRFDGLPDAYYDDWLQVAAEEAYHFSLLVSHLRTLGDQYDYGCFPAHDGLWDMARRTSGDWLARLALVPRTLEARGLDASPPIKAKLSSAGDKAGAAILDIILRDEIGHVAIGNRWYRWGCERAGFEPVETYARLAAQYGAPRLRGPFNLEARRAAGFDDAELAALQAGE